PPGPPVVNHDPAFTTPRSTDSEAPPSTGRTGCAGWVSPATRVGAEQTLARWDIAWFALGFAIEWGGPPPAAPAKGPPARRANHPRPQAGGGLMALLRGHLHAQPTASGGALPPPRLRHALRPPGLSFPRTPA